MVEKAELQITLLGVPTASWHGRTLDVPRRQVRALLFRLADTLRPIPRQQLCFLFWADTSESEARRNLTRLLSHLRDALPDPNLLASSDDCVGLDPGRVSSDVVAFRHLCGRDGEIDALRTAAELYRDPFLAGFSLPDSPEFEAWAREQQRDCERRYLAVLAHLIDVYAKREDHGSAIAYARRYLAANELAEAVHRRLIGLYAAAGDRAAALRQFERCTAVLERELGVRPLPETRAVYERAMNGRQPRTRPLPMDPSWATLPGPEVPMVGRDDVYGRLQEALTSASAGRGRVVLLSGEPGIGKSRLMEEFATGSGSRAQVLAAAARWKEEALPYQPVAEILRSIPDWQQLNALIQPVWLAEATRLLPELRQLHPDLPRPLPAEPGEARTRLLEALCRIVLKLAAKRGPVLLCLDDLHCADSATLDWLACLARRMRTHDCPILLLGTYRSEEQRAVSDLRHNLTRLGVLSEYRLNGLEPTSVDNIVRHLTGARSGTMVLSRRLHRATGGNPFFLLETVRALLEKEELPADLNALRQVPLPDTVLQAVETRLQRLDPHTRQVLEAGAILGTSFAFDLVHRTAGRGEMETIDGLDEAVAHGLLLEQRSGYRFRHTVIRQAVKRTLGPVRRHLLHRRAARALERTDPQAAGRIARHFQLGGDEEKALHHYRRATEQAETLFAWQEAEKIQTRMLELLDRLDPQRLAPEHLALRGEILASRAHLRFLQGRPQDRDTDLASLDGLAERADDDELRLLTILHRVRYLNLGGRYRDAIAEGERGIALARRLDDATAQSRLLAHVGFAHYFLGQPQPALVALESAMGRSGEQIGPAMRGRITHILGYVYYHLCEYTKALAYQEEACKCNRQIGEHNRTAWNLMDMGFLHLKLGRFDRAKELLSESLSLARRIAARPAEAYAITLLGDWELHRGNYAAALERFQESRAMQVEVGSKHGIVAAEDGAGFASYHLGDIDGAKRTLRRALKHAREIGHRRHIALDLIGLGLVELIDGAVSIAKGRLVEALHLARESECAANIALALAALARAQRKRGDPAAALRRALGAIQVADAHPLHACRAWGNLEAGLALLSQEKPKEALDHTSLAVEALPRTHEAWIGSEEIHRAHARVLQALGRVSEAREQTRMAEAVIQAKAHRIPDPEVRQRYLQHVTASPTSPVN